MGFRTKKSVTTGAITIGSAIDNFLTACRGKGLAKGTIIGYSSRLGNIFAEWCRMSNLEFLQDLEIGNIDAYLTYLSDKGYSDSSKRSVSVQLKTFLTWCKERGYKVNIDLRKMYHPRKAPDEKIRVVPDADLKKILDYLDKSQLSTHFRLNVQIHLWVETGLRITESCSLLLDEVDLKDGSISVLGKGKKRRIVYITRNLNEKLTLWFVERQNQLDDANMQSQWIFPSWHTKGKTCIQSQHPMAQLREICAELKLPKHTPHAFRHTFAVNWLKSGGDIRSLQQLMGHSSLEITQMYLKFLPSHIKHQAMKITSTMERIEE